MLGWIRRRLRRALYQRGRDIFSFHDGLRWRCADPIVIDRAIEAACPEWKKLIGFLTLPKLDLPPDCPFPVKLMDQAVANQERAIVRLTETTRKVFGLPALDDHGGGLTETEAFNLLAAFVEFTGRLAEAAGPLSNSPAPSAASPADSEQATTLPFAASTSAANASPPRSLESSPAV